MDMLIGLQLQYLNLKIPRTLMLHFVAVEMLCRLNISPWSAISIAKKGMYPERAIKSYLSLVVYIKTFHVFILM